MQQYLSYRDRDGFVVYEDNLIYRYVAISYAAAYDRLMQSGLYNRLVKEGLLIQHKESSIPDDKQFCYRVLIPEMVSTLSRPSEWTAHQWKDVVLAFFAINKIALEYGMILKDATPFNFTFHKGRCVFIDTLSFELYEEGQPWIAYRQFCETILGPAALIFFNDSIWARQFSSANEGWELSFISKNLPYTTWLRTSLFLHIHLHARFQNGSIKKADKQEYLNKEKLLVLWDMLEKSVAGWQYKKQSQKWTGYYKNDIFSDTYIESKTGIITQWLESVSPSRVIDLGANNGRFSEIAARYAREVIAVDADHDCIDEMYLSAKKRGTTNITTISADITQPTPGTGWLNQEKASLLIRLHGDMILVLALIHHLCISKNIPISFIASFIANMTTQFAIVEFVPKSDQKVKAMLLNRKDIFEEYTETEFVNCFNVYFRLKQVTECGSSDRKIYLWEKK